MRRSRFGVSVVASLSLLLSAAGTVGASGSERHLNLLDACDGPSFNAVLGAGACERNAGVSFETFLGQLLAMGQAPAWRNSPGQLQLPAGGTIEAHNKGGEFHTFTEVANFGGGCVDEVNALVGLTPVPECANAGFLFGTTGAAPGDEVETMPLASGVHRFECLIHPWMRTTVTVRG
jgi:hypothetical protein